MVFPKITLIDNYDSFTWNLAHCLEAITAKAPKVIRNDECDSKTIDQADALVFSPGPGLPSEAGRMNEWICAFSGSKRILGICLGHQAIGQVFGARLKNLPVIHHGVQRITHVIDRSCRIFDDIPDSFITGHYHSWVIDPSDLPEELLITAVDQDENIMAIRHSSKDVTGIQFHPESVMTPEGMKILKNWLTTG